LARFEFESGIVLFCFSFIFVSFGESRLLVSWCAGGRCGMACSDEDYVKSRRPGVEDRGCTQVSAFPSRNFDLSSSAASVCRSRLIWARRQGPRAKASCECHLSDRVGALSDRHLAQPGLCPIVPGLCPIVTWLSQVSVRSCRVSV
jgi:hypothetical protein